MSTELKPCPFCGGTEIYIGLMDHPGPWEYWTVGCNNYDCPLDADSVKVEGGTLEKAAAAWNTRAADANLAALQAEVEALRAERDALREVLEYIRNRSAINPFVKLEELGNIHQIADAALTKEGEQ